MCVSLCCVAVSVLLGVLHEHGFHQCTMVCQCKNSMHQETAAPCERREEGGERREAGGRSEERNEEGGRRTEEGSVTHFRSHF